MNFESSDWALNVFQIYIQDTKLILLDPRINNKVCIVVSFTCMYFWANKF